jgi:hypothetical protein
MTLRVHVPGNGFMNRADLVFDPCPLDLAIKAAAVMYPNAIKIEVME